MDRPLVDRRLDARFGQPAIAGTQAILRPGYAVALIDVSSGGALIQGPRPLRPGARVHLLLMNGTRRLAIGAHVLRCSVASLDSREGVQYRGALKFDHRCDVLWEADTRDGYLFPAGERALAPAGGHDLPGDRSEPDPRHEPDRD
ncbi:MAG TPA: PilZ domain-containing protein [Vicinamibacterales bacterium]|jgi:hypothetical protein